MSGENKTDENSCLPPKPIKPNPDECCNRNCENCVFVYYERAMQRWREKVKNLKEK